MPNSSIPRTLLPALCLLSSLLVGHLLCLSPLLIQEG